MVSSLRNAPRGLEEHRIWIHCWEPQEAEEVARFCRECDHLRRVPEVVPPPGEEPLWSAQLKLGLHKPPAPYPEGGWGEFLLDAGALIAASLRSASLRRLRAEQATDAATGQSSLDAMRRPSLLVTDSKRLCRAAGDEMLKGLLAEAASLQVEHLLPVVLSTDFKVLCGEVTLEAHAEVMESLVLRELDGSAAGQCEEFSPSAAAADVELKSGVYISGSPDAIFGARCLALLSNGRCAYSAVSPDGMRRVEANGPWELVNGQILVGGSAGSATVRYAALSASGTRGLGGSSSTSSEPISIAVEEVLSAFEPPMTFGECIVRVGDTTRAEFLKVRERLDKHCQPTQLLQGPPPLSAAQGGLPLKPSFPAVAEQSLRGNVTARTPRASPRTPSFPSRSARSEHSAGGMGAAPAGIACGASPSPPRGETLLAAQGAGQRVATCPLKPGSYSCQAGVPNTEEYRSFSLTLHADSTYKYREVSFHTVLESVHRQSVWSVVDGVLTLGHRGDAPGLLLSQRRGARKLERRAMRVEIPAARILARCSFSPPAREPFGDHVSIPESERVGGMIDPRSLALLDPPLDRARIPIHRFEDELRRLGLTDEAMSDITFLDGDKDGTISSAELHELQQVGQAAATPAVLHGLREALQKACGTLVKAFEFLAKTSSAQGIPGAELEAALHRMVSDPKLKAKCDKLKAWLKRATANDMAAVIASINPDSNSLIGLDDFLSLSLHTAMLSARNLEHFQSWIFERFGRSEESVKMVFDTLDSKHKGSLTEKAFIEGTKQFRYPCEPATARSIFAMMDTKFNGKVGLEEFYAVRSFSTKKLLRNLQELSAFATRAFGSIDKCFQQLLIAEQAHRKTSKAVDSISFEVFRKACVQGDLTKKVPPSELPLLFIFLDESTGARSNGNLSMEEWALLRAFNATALMGGPARLREFLEDRFSSMDEAFESLRASWLPQALGERLQRLALEGLVGALLGSSATLRSSPREKMKAKIRSTICVKFATGRQVSPLVLRAQPDPLVLRPQPDLTSDAAAKPLRCPLKLARSPCDRTGGGGGKPDLGEPSLDKQLRGAQWMLRPYARLPNTADGESPRRRMLPGIHCPPPGSRPGTVSAINWGAL